MAIFAALSGNRITTGEIMIPSLGLWSADIQLDGVPTLPASVTLTLGSLSLVGYVRRGVDYLGSLRVRIAGGFGGWQKTIPSKGYHLSGGVKFSTVLGDVANEIGERLSIETDRSLGADYVRESGPAQRQINRLATAWYIQPDGVTRIGTRGTSAIVSQFDTLHYNAAAGVVTVGITDAYGDWTPGRTFMDATVGQSTIKGVTHKIGKSVTRTEVMV